jgi:hypothetical protein
MNDEPTRCPICGYYFTIARQYAGYRCIDPGHWQAAGVLNPRDYYPMAKIASSANSEISRRGNGNNHSGPDCC